MSSNPSSDTASSSKTLESVLYTKGGVRLRLLDQRRLPLETMVEEINTIQDIWQAIQEMRVRGAPAIAVSAALGIAVVGNRESFSSASDAVQWITSQCDYLITSRPTAVNLANTLLDLKGKLLKDVGEDKARKEGTGECWLSTPEEVVKHFTSMAEAVWLEDIAYNEGIMRYGAQHLVEKKRSGLPSSSPAEKDAIQLRILTICNTGALATSRYGTALGVVRQLHYTHHLAQLYACETRPWNQGARLTVYECVQENIPCTLLCDSAVSALLSTPASIDAVVVGADRICQNGDTTNKIGTYHIAVSAKHHGVPFYVAAPSTTLDPHTPCGAAVPIEEREAKELTTNPLTGQRVVAEGPLLSVWNPVFDVTPAALITGGIITEAGVFEPKPTAPYFDIKAIVEACRTHAA